MKNNTFFRNSILAAAAIILSAGMVSCDDIASDDRYYEVADVTPVRNILIEDYTGQGCVNCPLGHEVMESLEEKYGDHIVGVSIHPSGQGSLILERRRTDFSAGRIGLATSEGAYYYEQSGGKSLPFGVVNGQTAGGYENWTASAKIQLTLPSNLDITINPIADTASNEVKVDVDLLPTADMEGQLMVWIVENGIVAQQKLPDNSTDKEYVHNNVFRASVNGQDGDSVSLTSGQNHHTSYTIEIRNNKEEKWNPENLAVVAFLKTANGIEQAKKVKVNVK
ncbi:MAG: Omp28 family outer membrane lipoprotein [Muribaculaceae bacterium]|nr:Omp28 family outer membrane lipoprotein [Muribaculaceae bacterium]